VGGEATTWYGRVADANSASHGLLDGVFALLLEWVEDGGRLIVLVARRGEWGERGGGCSCPLLFHNCLSLHTFNQSNVIKR